MRLWAALLAMLVGGCSHVAYYAQAIHGQAEINVAAKPIDEVLADPATDPKLAKKLQLARQARDFASEQLGLPRNDSFARYADLHRPYVVWNVFAAPALSTTPLEWCFPVAGCVAYRGYFSEAAAQAAGAQLQAEGFDVHVGGVPAYSTLGWFDDPLLNTFIAYPEAHFVGLVFHELAHQVVYLPGDTAFNESFATAVEEEGVRRWFARTPHSPDQAAHTRAQRDKRAFIALLARARDQLATVYASVDSAEAKQAAKARLLAALEAEYRALRQSGGGHPGFDRWFAQGALNNAKLASVAMYADRVPAFHALLAQSAGDLPGFYAKVKALAELPHAERNARLAAAETAWKLAAKAEKGAEAP